MIIRKGLKTKAGLSCDFSSEVLYHLSLYGLKPFEQMQSKGKLVSLILFFNSRDIFRCLFDHRFLDLQVLGWSPLSSLQFSIRLCVNPVNNFLVRVVRIFLANELSLANNLLCAFHEPGIFPMSGILNQFLYYKSVFLLKQFSIFILASDFMSNSAFSKVETVAVLGKNVMNVLISEKFFFVHDSLLEVWSDCIEVYMDGFLKGVGSVKVTDRAAVYFLAADMGIGAIALALECVLSSCSVVLYSNSQLAINACISEASLFMSDFHNQCWIERLQISYSSVSGNIKADALISVATSSFFSLPVKIQKKFLVAKKNVVSDNTHHFTGPGFDIVPSTMIEKIDWGHTMMVWHPNSHMFSEFTSKNLANLHTYLIKAVYRKLLVVIKKKLCDRSYPGMLCLLCGEVELSDHDFTCYGNYGLHKNILVETAAKWVSLFSLSCLFNSTILCLLAACSLDGSLYTAVCKGFVMRDWYTKAALNFERKGSTTLALMEFVRFVTGLYYARIWAARAKHRINMKKTGLVGNTNVVFGLFHSIMSMLSIGIVYMLGIMKSFAVGFSKRKLCQFFSDLGGDAFISIDM
ncbi:hypothetical protein G9A89_012364 [Geosiphon pyriformis]|nr:hypothetical protein G9A89_012364 [Geosiphon pyriformis]